MNRILYLVAIVCAIWVIYDVVSKQKKMPDSSKAIWIICAIFFSVITAVAYFVVVKR